MSQVVSQQYAITARLRSSSSMAWESIFRRGMWIAPGRWSSSASGLGSTSTSCAPLATSLRTSSRRISLGISTPPTPYSRPLLMLSIGDLVLDITIVPEAKLRVDDDNPAQISVGGGGQAANCCERAVDLGDPT